MNTHFDNKLFSDGTFMKVSKIIFFEFFSDYFAYLRVFSRKLSFLTELEDESAVLLDFSR